MFCFNFSHSLSMNAQQQQWQLIFGDYVVSNLLTKCQLLWLKPHYLFILDISGGELNERVRVRCFYNKTTSSSHPFE